MPTPALYASAPATATDEAWSYEHPPTETITRPATRADFDAVNQLHDRSSLASRFARYQSARRNLRLAEWNHLINPDRSISWVSHPQHSPESIVATMNLVRDTDNQTAELGLLIEDGWQGRGLGTALTAQARAAARTLGCSALVVMTGADNVRMLKILRGLGAAPTLATGPTIDFSLAVG
ncbi:GNAT family N-acetyltransferase [Streptomyces erythrochromogenes]|uniref:GNAT family N-acetyltransferase n=1 Tax=Streptomyces erythrochromogenes TaxID=285574 RepID=UPI0034374771